jgi:hypothetical protein
MKMTSLREETDEGIILSLFICGNTKEYAARMEKHMVGGVNFPGCRSDILHPLVGSIHIPDVISEWRIHLSKKRTYS